MIGGTYCALQRVAAEDVQWGVEVIEDGPGVEDRRREGGGGRDDCAPNPGLPMIIGLGSRRLLFRRWRVARGSLPQLVTGAVGSVSQAKHTSMQFSEDR